MLLWWNIFGFEVFINFVCLFIGAFLIPYIIFLILCGMPMFYMELAVGQYFSLGPLGSWGAACPLFQGNHFACTYHLFVFVFVL